QSDSTAMLPKKLKPQTESMMGASFENLKIQYSEKRVTLTWNAMPREVAAFQIYRSKRAYDDPKFGYTSQLLEEIPASSAKNRYIDTTADGVAYAYRVTALSYNHEILTTSIQLHPEQLFVMEGETVEVDFSSFSDEAFNKVAASEHDYLIFEPSARPRYLKITPKEGFTDGTKVMFRFLDCARKRDGSEYRQKVDEKTLEVYVNQRKTRLTLAY
ncbi:MAG: hypothetical protein V1913_12335, partial [Fibrobacterota bacterium]